MGKPPCMMTAEERALWARVIATVTPIKREQPVPVVTSPPVMVQAAAKATAAVAKVKGRVPPARPVHVKPVEVRAPTLDGSWDRRLSRGLVTPDSSIDLHGHSLSSAYAMLDDGLGRAIARGDRVLLLVTGKPPRPESERPHARGAIRAAVGDWLAASRHADRIAAVRNAHPRHGGQGALYIILRRDRAGASRNS